MAQARKWSNVAVAMQSAIAASKTITSITQANPGVATSVAHGLTNGNIVYLVINGMSQLNGRVARIAGVTTDTFQLEGIDTTNFDTFSTGTCAVVTLGTSITTATSISASGGDFDFIDTTTIHDNVRTQIPGIAASATYSMENIWDVSDAGLLAMKSAYDSQAIRAFVFTFGVGGQKMYFAGYVGATLLPGGQAQGLVTTPATITMFGSPTFYAS